MARTAKTARFRGCSSSRTSPMSARACSRRRSAWTRRSRSWCSRREGCRRRTISSCFATNGWRRRQRITSDVASTLGYPVFVKPANLGSSVGISKAKREADLAGGDRSGRGVRSQDRHRSGGAERARNRNRRARQRRARRCRCPAKSSRRASSTTTRPSISTTTRGRSSRPICRRTLTAEVKRLAIEVFRAVDCAGMARVDFLMDGATGKLYVNEINTIPGFTTISMYSKMWAASGVPYPELLDRLIALARERHAEKQQIRTSLDMMRHRRRPLRSLAPARLSLARRPPAPLPQASRHPNRSSRPTT